MTKDILIGGKAVRMTANAATAYRYKQVFGKDLMKIFQDIAKSEQADVNTFQELAYVMAKQASGEAGKISIDDYLIWLEAFDPFEIAAASGQIMELYTGQKITTSKPKKKADQQSES